MVGAALADGQPIVGAFPVEGDPAAVAIEHSGCDGDRDVTVVEETDELVLTLQGPAANSCEPLHHLIVELDAPLGDRRVVDGSTDEIVPIG